MRIHCLTPFMNGRDRFEKDDQRTVPDSDGARFAAAGWAQDLGTMEVRAPADGPVTLAIQSAHHDQEATHG